MGSTALQLICLVIGAIAISREIAPRLVIMPLKTGVKSRPVFGRFIQFFIVAFLSIQGWVGSVAPIAYRALGTFGAFLALLAFFIAL